MGTPQILRILYKYYGGIEFFNNYNIELLVNCLGHAVDKEQEIPKILNNIYNKIRGKDINNYEINRRMRTSEEILKDYGLAGEING